MIASIIADGARRVMKQLGWLYLLFLIPGCECSGIIQSTDDQRVAGQDALASDGAVPLPDGGKRDLRQPDVAQRCSGTHAYLHGDLWPMWYNMRMCCDGEHRALWRCERTQGAGAPGCSALRAHYQECLASPNSAVCPNWGVCCFKASNGCTEPTGEYLTICDTRPLDFESSDLWGTYYGRQWGSSTTLHRFMTVFVWDVSSRIAAFSSNPGEGDAYMDGLQNSGVGPAPQGHIQVITDKLKDRFGTFACIRLPAGQPLTLQAIWMNDFCHTCSGSYWSQPNTPCRTGKIPLTPEAGRHYLWTERGLEQLPGCAGPPPEVLRWLPQAQCSTVES